MKKKSIFCLMMLLVILTALICQPVSAGESYDDIGPGLKAGYSNGELTIMLKNSSVKNTISAQMYKYTSRLDKTPVPWTAIDTMITDVIIEDGVTGISDYAFDGCVNLKRITLYPSMNRAQSIGANAFRGCTSLSEVYFMGDKTVWESLKAQNTNPGNEKLYNAFNIHFISEPLQLDKENVVFDKPSYGNPYTEVSVDLKNSTGGIINNSIAYAESSDTSVATVRSFSNSLEIKPVAEGYCTINVTGTQGDSVSVNVTVNGNWTNYALNYITTLDGTYYGSPNVLVSTLSGAKGSLKIGSDTYEFTAADGEATIKLKKVYRFKEKYTLLVSIGSASCTRKGKIGSETVLIWAESSRKKPKKIKLELFSLHKGDVVKLTYKGKTYSKTIKKNFDNKKHSFVMTTKDAFTASSKMTVQVMNKYKQSIFKKKINLVSWFYDVDYDPDDMND